MCTHLTHAVPARWLAALGVHAAEAVIAQLVEQAVEQRGRALLVDAEFARFGVVIVLR